MKIVTAKLNPSRNAEKARLIAVKSAELDDKLEKLSDADTALDAVSDVAYRQAVSVVTAMAVKETQRADREEITALMKQVASPDVRMREKERSLVINWLDQARHAIRDTAKQVLECVVAVFKKSEIRTTAKEQIKEKARPAIHDLFQTYANKAAVQKPPAHASWMAKNVEKRLFSQLTRRWGYQFPSAYFLAQDQFKKE